MPEAMSCCHAIIMCSRASATASVMAIISHNGGKRVSQRWKVWYYPAAGCGASVGE